MDKDTTIGRRPGGAERPHESGAAAPGRGGRMSRQRKTTSVLRLLRGEDLEEVSRSLGVTAATLAGWRDAFVAAGEAVLTTKPATSEDLESDRLKARLGAALLERDCWRRRSPSWRPIALWAVGGSGHEPGCFAGQQQAVWLGGSQPGLAACPIRSLPSSVAATVRHTATAAARTNRRDVRRCADGGDPCRAGRQPVPWRRPSQGLGTVATLRHPELVAAGASIDARE